MKPFTSYFFVLSAILFLGLTASYAQVPIADFTADKTTICKGESITFTNTSTGSIDTYSWDFGTNTSDSEGPHTIVYDDEGTFEIYLAVVGSEGTSTKTMNITVNPVPDANAGFDLSMCAGSSVALLPFPSSSNYEYEWSPAPYVTNPSIPNPAASPILSTNFTLKVTDMNQCSSTDQVYVEVHDNPSVSVTADAALLCIGESTTLHAIVAGTSPVHTFQWTPSASLSDPTVASPVAHPTFSGITTYSVTATDAHGCSGNGIVSIQANPLPQAKAGQDQYITTSSTVFDATTFVSGSGTWSLISGSGTIEMINNAQSPVTGLGMGTNIFKWEVSNVTCINSDTVVIEVGTITTNAISGPTTIDLLYAFWNFAYEYSVPFDEDESYEWSVDSEDPFYAIIQNGQYTHATNILLHGPIFVRRPALRSAVFMPNAFVVSVKITDSFGSKVIRQSIDTDIVGATSAPQKEYNTYSAYPNPFSENIIIKINTPTVFPLSLKIVDSKGHTVHSTTGHWTNEDILLTPNLLPGIYEVQASYQQQHTIIKIVKF